MSNDKARALPVFIIAPSRRCGTTLIQRALNSSSKALIYGENFNFLENYPAILGGVWTNLAGKKERTKLVRDQVLGGFSDIDASALFPDYEEYAGIMRRHFYAIAQYYERATLSYGRNIWGLKHQIRRFEAFSMFRQLLPTARYIFLYRNIFDIARSDKARFPLDYRNPDSFTALGRNWSRNTGLMRKIVQPNVLHVEYEELSREPLEVIAKLHAHCPLSGIRPEVFRNRINVSPIIDQLAEKEIVTSYRPPADLTNADLEALRSEVEDACRTNGYVVPSWAAR